MRSLADCTKGLELVRMAALTYVDLRSFVASNMNVFTATIDKIAEVLQ